MLMLVYAVPFRLFKFAKKFLTNLPTDFSLVGGGRTPKPPQFPPLSLNTVNARREYLVSVSLPHFIKQFSNN